ncbi:MAG: hypothetical protein AABW64_04240 [Nanoarchaeota archaeon]
MNSSTKTFVLALFIIGVSFSVSYLQDYDTTTAGNVVYERKTIPRPELYSSSPPIPASLPSCCRLGSRLEVPVPGNSCLVQIYNCKNQDPVCDGQDPTYTGPANEPVTVGGKTLIPPATQLTIPIPIGQGGRFSKGPKVHICVQPNE